MATPYRKTQHNIFIISAKENANSFCQQAMISFASKLRFLLLAGLDVGKMLNIRYSIFVCYRYGHALSLKTGGAEVLIMVNTSGETIGFSCKYRENGNALSRLKSEPLWPNVPKRGQLDESVGAEFCGIVADAFNYKNFRSNYWVSFLNCYLCTKYNSRFPS